MTLATLRRAAVLAPPLPVSPGRRKVREAARLLQEGLNALYEEDRAKADARERAWRETEAKVARRLKLAEAKRATRDLRVEVPAKWFWDFANGALDSMRDLAAEAKRQGQNGPANALEDRIDAAVKTLDEIQKRAAK
jgi:hypothetical protein